MTKRIIDEDIDKFILFEELPEEIRRDIILKSDLNKNYFIVCKLWNKIMNQSNIDWGQEFDKLLIKKKGMTNHIPNYFLEKKHYHKIDHIFFKIRHHYIDYQKMKNYNITRFRNYIYYILVDIIHIYNNISDFYYPKSLIYNVYKKYKLLLNSIYENIKQNKTNKLYIENFTKRDLCITFFEERHIYKLLINDKNESDINLFQYIQYSNEKIDDNEELIDIEKNNDTLEMKLQINKPKLNIMTSVTKIIHKMFEPFDADIVIDRMMKNTKKWENQNENKYYGMNKEEIKLQWKNIRESASVAGTLMHKSIEDYYNDNPYNDSTDEFKLFKEYEIDFVIKNNLSVFRTEWLIYDLELKLTGSVDILYEYINDPIKLNNDPFKKKHLYLCDWKRSKEIKKSNIYQSGIVEATKNCYDCNFVQYSLQLSIYKYILEKNYNVIIDKMFLIVLHPNQKHYIKEEVVWNDKFMNGVIEFIKTQ